MYLTSGQQVTVLLNKKFVNIFNGFYVRPNFNFLVSFPDKSFSFLQGGGEMGDLTRVYPWHVTSLGDPAQWPQSLRTILSVLYSSKFPMFLWWGPELIQFYNDAYRPSLGNGGKHPKALGQRGEECWPEIWPVIKPLIDQVLSGGESTWSENQLIPIDRNGKLEDVYWTFSYSPVRNEEGKIGGVLVVCNETTQQVVTLNHLRESDTRFQNLVRDTPVGIVVLTGPEFKIEIVNKGYCVLINRTPEELIHKELFSIVPEAEEHFRPILDKVRVTGEAVYLNDYPYFIHVDGKKRDGYLNLVYQPYRESDGKITGVMALCHEVTEQVQIRKKVQEAEERAKLAIASADLGSYEVNLKTNHMTSSDRYKEIWEIDHSVSREELLKRIHEDDLPLRTKANDEALITGSLHYEARFWSLNRTLRWIRASGKVLYDKEGKPEILLGIVQDITEQKEFTDYLNAEVDKRTEELQAINEEMEATNEELSEANDNLVRANKELEQFSYAASHDMREPLRKVQTFANLLLARSEALNDLDKEYIRKITSSTNRMKTIIDDLLEYSRTARADQQTGPVDLNLIVEDVLTDLEVAIAQKNATVTVGKLPVISGTATQMYQVFQNIISNALKFSKQGKPPVVSVQSEMLSVKERNKIARLSRNQDYSHITIADNGIGFSPKYADHVFELFKRLHGRSEYSGTGIGLALCKKIVEYHSGYIYAESEEGVGTTLHIILPVIT